MSSSYFVWVHDRDLKSDPLCRIFHFGLRTTHYRFVDLGYPPDSLFLLQSDTDISVFIDDREMMIKAGEGILLSHRHKLRYGRQGPWRRSFIRIGGSITEGLPGRFELPLHRAFPLSSDVFEWGLACLFQEVSREMKPNMEIAQLGVSLLFRHIQRAFREKHPVFPADAPVVQAERWFRMHYRETFKLSDLASRCGLSLPHFMAQFKKRFGHPPLDYCIRLRVEEAKERLLRGPLSVSEIAKSVGYENPLYFSRVFSKITGLAPSVWRERHQPKDPFTT